jgi:hypothetical protein
MVSGEMVSGAPEPVAALISTFDDESHRQMPKKPTQISPLTISPLTLYTLSGLKFAFTPVP